VLPKAVLACAPPARLPRLALGINVPVSATLAPLSRLAIRLLVLSGLPTPLPSPVQGTLSALGRRARYIDARGLSDGRRGDVILNESAGETDMSLSCCCVERGIATGSVMVSSAGERTGLPTDGGSPNDDATDGGGTEG